MAVIDKGVGVLAHMRQAQGCGAYRTSCQANRFSDPLTLLPRPVVRSLRPAAMRFLLIAYRFRGKIRVRRYSLRGTQRSGYRIETIKGLKSPAGFVRTPPERKLLRFWWRNLGLLCKARALLRHHATTVRTGMSNTEFFHARPFPCVPPTCRPCAVVCPGTLSCPGTVGRGRLALS